MASKDSDSLVVLESFVGSIDKQERVFRKGELVRAGDPAAKKWPQFFGTPDFLEARIEQATAAPGEKRGEK